MLKPLICYIELYLLATYSLSIAYLSLIIAKPWRKALRLSSLLHIDLVCKSFHLLIKHFTSQIQSFFFKNHAYFVKQGSIYTFKHMEGGLGCGHAPSGLGTAQCHECSIAHHQLCPCGLGCQQLGLRCYPCSDHYSVCSHLSLAGITSHPAPLL